MLRRILEEIRRGGGRRTPQPAPAAPPPRRPEAEAALREGRLRDALAELAGELTASAPSPELRRLLMASLVDLARRNEDPGSHDKVAYLLGSALLAAGDIAGAERCARARAGAPPESMPMQAFRIEPSLPAYCARAGLPVIATPELDLEPMSPGATARAAGTASFACALRPGLVLGTSFIPASVDGSAFTARCIHRPDKVTRFEAREVVDSVQLGTASRLLVAAGGTDRHEGIHVLIGSSDNAGHWLLNYFSRLMMATMIPGIEHATFVVGAELGPMQADCLAHAGIAPDRVLRLAPGRIAQFEELWVPSMPYGFVDDNVLCWSPASLAFIRRTLKLAFTATRTRRLYLSRAGARWRRLVNEDAVLAAIADLGFEVVDPGALSLAQQIELAAEAGIIAGPMGAGMNLLMFAAEGTPVVTIKGPIGGMMDIDPFLARELRHPYFAVVGRSLPTSPDPLRCDLEAAPGEVRATLLRALAAAA